jgi:stage II sporulation protein GA (sporulation sigma-E factor processing peptidase)
MSNLIINLILLYASAFITNRKASFFRCLIGSGIGAIYLCIMFFSSFSFLENIVFKFIVSTAMIFTAFHFKKFLDFIKNLLIYYILNFILAGGINFSNSIWNSSVITNGSVYFKTTIWTMLLGIFIVFLFGTSFFKIIKSAILSRELNKELTLYHCNNKIKLNAFVDTGNSLIDPLSRTSVVIVSKEKLSSIIDYKNLEGIKNFRIIPCQTVADKPNILYGFKPDKLIFDNKELNATIAISEIPYDAIINPLTLI